MGRKLLSLPDVSVRITSRLTKSFIPLPFQTPSTAIFLPTSPFLRPGISGHTQILQTPLEEARKKCETIYKPFELPVSDRGEEFLFLCFTCALFICCQKTENDRKDKDLINNPSYLTLVWRHSVTALTYLVILFWGHAIQSASNDLLPY